MKDLTKEETEQLLNTVGDGVLALSDNDTPYCIPFGFVYVGGAVCKRTIRFVLLFFAGMMITLNGLR